jgi:4a-hydroxytetrahydrobiopterin dehydratase
MTNLSRKKCKACEGLIPRLSQLRIRTLLKELDGWKVVNGRLTKTFAFNNFRRGLSFVNKVGQVAEQEGHHPDIFLAWGVVRVNIYTHSLKGLSENDFILAAKIDLVHNPGT